MKYLFNLAKGYEIEAELRNFTPVYYLKALVSTAASRNAKAFIRYEQQLKNLHISVRNLGVKLHNQIQKFEIFYRVKVSVWMFTFSCLRQKLKVRGSVNVVGHKVYSFFLEGRGVIHFCDRYTGNVHHLRR